MTARERFAEALSWAAMAGILVAAVAWRLPWLDLPYTSDEIGTTTTATRWQAILRAQETGVNPPLVRLLNLVASPWDTPWIGRRIALGASLLAVPAAWGLVRLAGAPSRWAHPAAAMAAVMLAVHPWCVRYGVLYRAYAPFSLTVLLLGLGLAWAARGGRGGRLLAVVAAVLLPWWHYLGIPVLVGVAGALLVDRTSRRFAWVPAVGLVGIVPVVALIPGRTGRRVAPDVSLEETLRMLTSLGLHPPAWFKEGLWERFGAWAGWYPPLGDVAGAAVMVVAVVGLWRWRTLPVAGRALWGGLVVLGLALVVVGRIQLVRPSTLVMVVSLVAPSAVLAALALPGRWGPPLGLAAMLGWWAPTLPPAADALRGLVADAAAVGELVDRWPELMPQDVPVALHPAREIWSVYFHLAQAHPRQAEKGPTCAGWEPCATWGGWTLVGLDRLPPGSSPDVVVISLDRWRPDDFAASCTPWHEGRGWRAWTCGAASAALPEADPGDAVEPGSNL